MYGEDPASEQNDGDQRYVEVDKVAAESHYILHCLGREQIRKTKITHCIIAVRRYTYHTTKVTQYCPVWWILVQYRATLSKTLELDKSSATTLDGKKTAIDIASR